MSIIFDNAKPVLKFGWKSLKIAFICFRCLLWSLFFFFIIFCSNYFRKEHLDFAWLLLVLLSLPITVMLIIRQFVSDIRLLRNKYAKNLFDNSLNELNEEQSELFTNFYAPSTEDAGNVIFWNAATGIEYRDINDYLNSFLERQDNNAKEMRSVITKGGMKSLILSARNDTHSIRYWEESKQISFDYESPIPINFIESFSIRSDTSIIRGDSITKKETRYKGYSYPFLPGLRNYRGKGKTTYKTIHQPDIIVKDYSVIINISGPAHEIKRMYIRNNQYLVDGITCFFRNLGIQQIYQ